MTTDRSIEGDCLIQVRPEHLAEWNSPLVSEKTPLLGGLVATNCNLIMMWKSRDDSKIERPQCGRDALMSQKGDFESRVGVKYNRRKTKGDLL